MNYRNIAEALWPLAVITEQCATGQVYVRLATQRDLTDDEGNALILPLGPYMRTPGTLRAVGHWSYLSSVPPRERELLIDAARRGTK